MPDTDTYLTTLIELQQIHDVLLTGVDKSRFDNEGTTGSQTEASGTYNDLIDKERETSLYSLILLNNSESPDPRAFKVSQIFSVAFIYASRMKLDITGIVEILEKILTQIISNRRGAFRVENKNAHRNADWLFYRVLERFLSNEEIDVSKKVSVRALIQNCDIKWIFPLQIIRCSCTGYNTSDWIHFIKDNPEQSLISSFDSASIFREVDIDVASYQQVTALCTKNIADREQKLQVCIQVSPSNILQQATALCTKNIADRLYTFIVSMDIGLDDIFRINIRGSWTQTLLHVLRGIIDSSVEPGSRTELVIENLEFMQKIVIEEKISFMELVENSDETLFCSMTDMAWILFKIKPSLSDQQFSVFSTCSLFGLLLHKFNYDHQVFIEILLSSEACLDVVRYFLFILKLSLNDKSTFLRELATLNKEISILQVVEFFEKFALSLDNPNFIFNAKPLIRWMKDFTCFNWATI